jgi:hypothetical protein
MHGFEPGLLLAVNPRNYNGGSCGCCAGDVTPYLFYWGMAMGSDAGVPKEIMFIYMSITSSPTSCAVRNSTSGIIITIITA